MKKAFIMCLMVCVFLCATEKTYAAQNSILSEDVLINSDDFVEIKELERDLKEWVLSLSKSLNENIDLEDIKIIYDKTIKIYTECDIFLAHSSEEKDILELASNGDYIWEIPIEAKGERFSATAWKSRKPDEEAKQYLSNAEWNKLEKNAGKWAIASVGRVIDNVLFDYDLIESKLSAKLDEGSYVKVFSGQAGFIEPIAVAFEKGKAVSVIPIRDVPNEYQKPFCEVISFKEILDMQGQNTDKRQNFEPDVIDTLNMGIPDANDELNTKSSIKKVCFISVIGLGLSIVAIIGRKTSTSCRK